ncbi:hypothetical protein [Winogradskyella forsetii]|uniref:hypothetical protein n=1 Tax=Winogradskyella forsetii TaxID=2686077 RepID=UPI0015B81D31|nr:hypothetical protein [Winogradskyella forsetii]
MKKYLLIAISFLLAACSNDGSDNTSQNNPPSGALIKVEVYFPTTNTHYIVINSFDSNGRIKGMSSETISSDGTTNQYSTTFFYNDSGQIWKTSYIDDRAEEYYFTDDLISSSTFYNENNGERRYLYNTLNQLNHIQYLNEDNVEVATKDITFDSNGNINNTYLLNLNNDSFTEYTFEYDNKNNPYLTLFNDQEIKKIIEYNFNNKTERIYSTNNGINVFTLEYTYNESDYPITSIEYMDGELITQSTFTYQE